VTEARTARKSLFWWPNANRGRLWIANIEERCMADLEDFRRRIDAIDDRLLTLLGERYAVIREVAAYKAPRGIPAIIPARVAEVKERCAGQAPAHGLDAAFVRGLYTLVIDEACRLEELSMDRPSAGLNPS
jgi:4-amino-4-deoxychorismate mutase